MTEEIQETVETKDSCKCFVHCECVRKFFIVAFGSFVGVFCALSLFAALHKPPFPCPMKMKMHPPVPVEQQIPPMDDHKPMK